MEPKVSKPLLGKNFGARIAGRFRNRLRKVVVTDGNSNDEFELVENPDNPTEMVVRQRELEPICTFTPRNWLVQASRQTGGAQYTGINVNDMEGDYLIQVSLHETNTETPADATFGFQDVLRNYVGTQLTWNNIKTEIVPLAQTFTTHIVLRDIADEQRINAICFINNDLVNFVRLEGAVDASGRLYTGIYWGANPIPAAAGTRYYTCFRTPQFENVKTQTRTYDGFVERVERRKADSTDLVQMHKVTMLLIDSDMQPSVGDRIECDDVCGSIDRITYAAPDDSYIEALVI